MAALAVDGGRTRPGCAARASDPALAAHLTGQDGMVAAHRFIAELAITWLERPADTRAVLVHLPPEAPLDTDAVSAARAPAPPDRPRPRAGGGVTPVPYFTTLRAFMS